MFKKPQTKKPVSESVMRIHAWHRQRCMFVKNNFEACLELLLSTGAWSSRVALLQDIVYYSRSSFWTFDEVVCLYLCMWCPIKFAEFYEKRNEKP